MMKEDVKAYFDTSEYPQPNRFDIPSVNKKVLGKMKDECNGNILKSFVGISEKVYAMEILNEDNSVNVIKKAAGTNRNVVRDFTLSDYFNCLKNEENKISDNFRIDHKKHIVKTLKISKVALSVSVNKRISNSENPFDTFAIGHYKTRKLD